MMTQPNSFLTIEDRVVLILAAEMYGEAKSPNENPEEGVFAHLVASRRPASSLAGHGFWEKLGERTFMPAQRWRSVFARRQRPTPQMIEALARLWPAYGFWLATGLTDAINGHVAPRTAVTFPERLYNADPWSESYFDLSRQLGDQLAAAVGSESMPPAERTKLATRTPVMTKWIGGPVEEKAYELARTDDYADLMALWEEREKARTDHLERVTGQNRPWETKQRAPGSAFPVFGPKTQSQWDLFFKPEIFNT